LRSLQDSMSSEIRLSDYRSDIEQLLTIDDNPDSTVRLSIELNGAEAYSLEITPHEAVVQRTESTIQIKLPPGVAGAASEENIHVYAIRIEAPGEEPTPLSEVKSDAANCRSWDFGPNLQECGCWLIYPARDSRPTFRPTLWNVSGEINSSNEYLNAIVTRHGLDDLIGSLAADFSHPNWIEVEQLAEQVGHLPLATFDLWRKFARNSRAMAALALRFSNLKTEFLFRFAEELPFSWEIVTWEDWRTAACSAENYCKDLFPEDTYKTVFDAFLRSRIASLATEVGSLAYLLGILSANYLEAARQEAIGLRIVGQTATARLLHGADSSLMNLRRTHYDDNEEWPCSFLELLKESKDIPDIARYLCSERLGFQDSVINLPLILSSQVVLNRTANWFHDSAQIHALRTHRAFDPDWYDEAFNQTIAQCLADGLLDS
ncbi:MAG: STY4851/ECs_5259 family protein, partial [Pirellulaceae bacterium]